MSYYTYDYIYGMKIDGKQETAASKSSKKNKNASKNSKQSLKTLVRWQGYSQDESTWEPYKNMDEDGAFEIVKKFMQEYTYQNYIKRKNPQITTSLYCDNDMQVVGEYYPQVRQEGIENENDNIESENNLESDVDEPEQNFNQMQEAIDQNKQDENLKISDKKIQEEEILNQIYKEIDNIHQNENQIFQESRNEEDLLNTEKQPNFDAHEQVEQPKQMQVKKLKPKSQSKYKYDPQGGFTGQDRAVKIVNHFVGNLLSLVTYEYEYDLYYEVEFGYDFDGSRIKNNYSDRLTLMKCEKRLFQAYIKEFPESEELWKEVQEEKKLEDLKRKRKMQNTIDSD